MKLTINYVLTQEDTAKIKECKDTELDISQSRLSASQITKLFKALAANSNIKKLILNSVRFVDDQATKQFIQEMQTNQAITQLNICDTPALTEETQDLRFPMTDILTKNNSIRQLWIGNEKNPLKNALVLQLFKNKNLTLLHIKYMSLTIEGLRGVSQYLQTSSLRILELPHCTIKNEASEGEICAAILQQGLKANKNLLSVNLNGLQFLQDNNEKLVHLILDGSPHFWKKINRSPKAETAHSTLQSLPALSN